MARQLSSPTQKVLKLLHAAERPLSAYDILAKLHRQGVRSPPTVYRALERLTKQGLVHHLKSRNAFIACPHKDADGRSGPHASSFAICTSCGDVREITDAVFLKSMKKLGEYLFAHKEENTLEFSGTCHKCGDKAK